MADETIADKFAVARARFTRPGKSSRGGDTQLGLEGSTVPWYKRPGAMEKSAPAAKAAPATSPDKPDVLGAFRQAGKGYKQLRDLTSKSRSPSK